MKKIKLIKQSYHAYKRDYDKSEWQHFFDTAERAKPRKYFNKWDTYRVLLDGEHVGEFITLENAIILMYIDNQYRGEGIGSRLIEIMKEKASKYNHVTVMSNPEAMAYWENQGFIHSHIDVVKPVKTEKGYTYTQRYSNISVIPSDEPNTTYLMILQIDPNRNNNDVAMQLSFRYTSGVIINEMERENGTIELPREFMGMIPGLHVGRM